MFRHIATFILFLVCNALLAQTTEKPTINLQGKATSKVLPDVAVIDFHIRSKARLENEALTKLNSNANALLSKLQSLGFNKDQVRITNFYLHEDYIYTDGTSRRIGFIAGQSVQLRFPYEKEKLASLMSKLSTERSEDVSLSFGTDISDELEKKVRNSLIEKALADAREKAGIIARASGVQLGQIYRIDYGQSSQPPVYPMYKSASDGRMMTESQSVGAVEATEIELWETLQVSFLIGQ